MRCIDQPRKRRQRELQQQLGIWDDMPTNMQRWIHGVRHIKLHGWGFDCSKVQQKNVPNAMLMSRLCAKMEPYILFRQAGWQVL